LYSPQGLSADESVSATRWDWGASVGNSVTESHYNFSIMAAPLCDAWQRWSDHVEALAGQAASASNVVRIGAVVAAGAV
jgi:hypothetical protein